MWFASTNNQLMSTTAETFHDPIGPIGLYEQSVNRFRHSLMTALSSSLDPGSHPVAGYYYRDNKIGLSVRITTIIAVKVTVGSRAGVRVTPREGVSVNVTLNVVCKVVRWGY